MRKVFKKAIFVLLSAVMILGAAPFAGLAGRELPEFDFFSIEAEAVSSGTFGSDVDNLTWSFDEMTGELTIFGTGDMPDFDYNDRSQFLTWVKNINEHSIETVTILEGVTSICDYAFYGCSSLKSVTIPESVIRIGENAFNYDIRVIYYHGTPERWNEVLFEPDEYFLSHTHIIYDCSDKHYYGAGSCGDNVEWKLYTDGNLIISGNGPMYDFMEETDGQYMVTDAPWMGYNSKNVPLIKNVTIENGVTSIGVGAFSFCERLEGVVIPDSVTTIGEMAFLACSSLKSIYIPASVSRFSYVPDISGGESGCLMFGGCTGLENITVSDDNPYFSSSEDGVLFNKDKTVLIQYPLGSKITTYAIPDSVTKVEHAAFLYSTSVQNITIPESVTSIGIQSFSYCESLVNVTILGNITSMGDGAFLGSPITDTLTIDDGVEVIGVGAFAWCDLKEVAITGSVTKIGNQAFYACSALENVEILDGVKNIDSAAFSQCTAMKSIIIPESIETFGEDILGGTTTEIKYRGSEKQWNEIEKGENDFSNNRIIFNYGNNLVNVTDPDTGIIVSGLNADDYDGRLSLHAKECSEEETNIKVSGSLWRKSKLYDITIKCEGETVQPTGTVTVRIPLPKGFIENRTKIYYIDDETGDEIQIPSTIEDGFVVFTIDHFSYYALVEDFEIKIMNNQGSKTINYGETLRLTAITDDIPADVKFYWYVDGEKKGEGETFDVKFESGTKTVEVKLVDENGNILKNADGNEISDSENVSVKSGFLQKLISFFKNLFRINRTVVQVFKIL